MIGCRENIGKLYVRWEGARGEEVESKPELPLQQLAPPTSNVSVHKKLSSLVCGAQPCLPSRILIPQAA